MIQLTQFLMGLNDQFTSIRGHILPIKPLPSLSQSSAMLLQDENQREVSGQHQSNTEYMTMSGTLLVLTKISRELLTLHQCIVTIVAWLDMSRINVIASMVIQFGTRCMANPSLTQNICLQGMFLLRSKVINWSKCYKRT